MRRNARATCPTSSLPSTTTSWSALPSASALAVRVRRRSARATGRVNRTVATVASSKPTVTASADARGVRHGLDAGRITAQLDHADDATVLGADGRGAEDRMGAVGQGDGHAGDEVTALHCRLEVVAVLQVGAQADRARRIDGDAVGVDDRDGLDIADAALHA